MFCQNHTVNLIKTWIAEPSSFFHHRFRLQNLIPVIIELSSVCSEDNDM
jgi:hypothetical protein